MIRKFKLYIQDIIDSIHNLQEYTSGMNFEEFRRDKKTIDAVIRNFEIIGEATKNVPDEIRNKLNDIGIEIKDGKDKTSWTLKK